MRGLRAARRRFTVGLLLVAVGATAGCSILIGVAGDPVVVDFDGGNAVVEAGVDSGDEADSPIAQDAASADEADAGDADDGDGALE